MDGGAWWAAAHGVAKSLTRLSDVTFHFHALEKAMATHSSVLAWRIPGTGEPGGLLSMGSHRVGHDWSDLAAAAAAGVLQALVANIGDKSHASGRQRWKGTTFKYSGAFCSSLLGQPSGETILPKPNVRLYYNLNYLGHHNTQLPLALIFLLKEGT